MNFLINLIASPLGWLMKWIYHLVNNYGIAIVLFTFITKLILFPVSYKQQKSSARMQLLNPKLKKLQERYKDKPEKLQMAQMQLYQDENINPYSSCLTAFIPLILLWGVLAVVYQPMTHILDYDKATIEEAKAIVVSMDEDPASVESALEKNSMRQELIVMERLLRNPDAFREIVENGEFTFIDVKDNQNKLLKQVESITPGFVTEVTYFAKPFTLGSVN
ncbi:MAG: membrane protein insertase YidC, partial [Oscillospiraceae bacterium]|nr:membrane protein insertase YidC [Oscillospiraceae bacterium]